MLIKITLNYIRLILIINLNISFLTCTEHKENLSKYLLDKSSMFFIKNWCKEVGNILTGKSILWDLSDIMKVKAHRLYTKNKGRKR